MKIDTTLLHAKMASRAEEFLRELFGEKSRRAGPDQWRVGRHGSLAIGIEKDRLVYLSHEDQQGGDAVALWQRERGGTPGEALKACAAWAGLAPACGGESAPRRKRSQPPPPPPPPPLPQPPPGPSPQTPAAAAAEPEEPARMTDAQFAEAHGFMKRLGEDKALCRRIAQSRADRGWTPEVIRGLAGDGGLGWCDQWVRTNQRGQRYTVHSGALTFHYHSGIKHRWLERGERVIRWYCGNGSALWRGWMLSPAVRQVFICEGETDAITLLSAGWEKERPEELVVALSSAGAIPPNLAPLMAGREVFLVGDHDAAGEKTTAKLTATLKTSVAGLKGWTL